MVTFKNIQTKGGLLMNTPELKEKPMPIIYTTKDICKMFYIGRVKCLELFHRAGFPAQKYVRGFGIEANACIKSFKRICSRRHYKC